MGRPRLTSADNCVLSKGDVGRLHLMLGDHIVLAKGDGGNQRSMSLDRHFLIDANIHVRTFKPLLIGADNARPTRSS